MNTKNTKSAVIILLMIANIFFIYNIIMLNVRTQNIPSAMIENAVNVLGNNGFSVDKNVIPVKKPTNYIYEGVYSGNIFKELVAGFSEIPEEEIQELPALPDGKIKYNEGNYIFIFDKSDYLKINIMDESHEKAKDDYRVIEIETEEEIGLLITQANSIMSVQKNDIKKAEKIIKDFLKKYYKYQKIQKSQSQDIKLDVEIDIISLKKETGSEPEKVIINQKVDGLPVNSHIVYVEIKNGEVLYFYGTWYFGSFVARYKMPLLDSVNILFKYFEKDGNNAEKEEKLIKMDIEYNIQPHESGDFYKKFYLMPSWTLIFGDGKKSSYDMITGIKN